LQSGAISFLTLSESAPRCTAHDCVRLRAPLGCARGVGGVVWLPRLVVALGRTCLAGLV